MMRLPPVVELITPAVAAVPIVELGYPKLGWFSVPKVSHRNSKWPYSPIEKTLPRARFMVTLSGPLRMFRPELPKPEVGIAKQVGSNHSVMVRFDRVPLHSLFGRVAWPRSWVPETFGVKGCPL